MTDDSIPRDAWSAHSGVPAGSRRYTSSDHPGWEIYDAGAGGVLTIYRDGENVATRDSLAEAIKAIEFRQLAASASNAIELTRRVLTADEFEQKTRVLADLLGGEGQLATARELLLGSGVAYETGVVDPNRVVPEDEFKALVTVETAVRMIRIATQVIGRPYEEGSLDELRRRTARAQLILSHAAGELDTRHVTAVKQQTLADRIAGASADRIQAIMAKIDPPLEFTDIPPGFTDKAPGASDHQRAFDVPGDGYAVFTRLNDGRVEVEYTYRQNGQTRTETFVRRAPDTAMADLVWHISAVTDPGDPTEPGQIKARDLIEGTEVERLEFDGNRMRFIRATAVHIAQQRYPEHRGAGYITIGGVEITWSDGNKIPYAPNDTFHTINDTPEGGDHD